MNKYTHLLNSFSQLLAQSAPQHWADLGCGRGVFTEALAIQLPKRSSIIGIDKTAQQLATTIGIDVSVNFKKADFISDDLPLSALDGILMANAFHFVKTKEILIRKLEKYFKSEPRFIIVEYDHDQPNQWEPYPVPFVKLKKLFTELNYQNITKIAELKSVYGGMMYAGFCEK